MELRQLRFHGELAWGEREIFFGGECGVRGAVVLQTHVYSLAVSRIAAAPDPKPTSQKHQKPATTNRRALARSGQLAGCGV
jgi:hypothetical protein